MTHEAGADDAAPDCSRLDPQVDDTAALFGPSTRRWRKRLDAAGSPRPPARLYDFAAPAAPAHRRPVSERDVVPDRGDWAHLVVEAVTAPASTGVAALPPVAIVIDGSSAAVTYDSPGALEVAFDYSSVSPTPLGTTYVVPRELGLFSAATRWGQERVEGPRAALVPVAQTGGGVSLIGLMACRSVSLQGRPDEVDRLLHAMAVEAAAGRWSARVDVVLVGFGEEMHALDGVLAVDGEREAVEVARGLRTENSTSGRSTCAAPGEDVGPPTGAPTEPAVPVLSWRRHAATVFFVGGPADPGAIGELVALTSEPGGEGMSVVVGGPVGDARWRLDVGALAGPLESALVAQPASPPATPTADGDAAIDPHEHHPAELHRAARADSTFTRPERGVTMSDSIREAPPRARATRRGQATDPVAAQSPAGGPLEVDVLGAVRVKGTVSPLDRRPKLTELVVYLALHPDGATTDAWATALWPDRRMPLSTLSNRLSEARIALGPASDGFAHLRKRGGRYFLGPEVITDWDRFGELSSREDDPAAWRSALSLVRGRPFDGLREAQWTILEGVIPAMESAIVELACRLGERLLASADAEGAEWAARRAMLVCPWDERLYRLVMRSADAAGNRAGVEAALRQLARVLEVDDDPLAAVHPETACLYRQLTGCAGPLRRAT